MPPFDPKEWKNKAAGGTELDAAALIDLEQRVTAYTNELLEDGGVGRIDHGFDPDVERGTEFAVYIWFGTVEPLNMGEDDVWLNTETFTGDEPGAVTSVFGRDGDVVAEEGDYSASDITGLGDAATKNVGTGSTQVAAGNDSRFPSAGQKNALAGLHGTPGTGNEYATKQSIGAAGEAGKALAANDGTTTNSRTPTAHATSHKTGGSDALAPSDIGAEASANKDTDATLAANSDTKYASQKATKSAIAAASVRIEDRTFAIVPTAATLGGFFIRLPSGEGAKLIGMRFKTASGTCKLKVKRTTAGGSSSEPLKEKEAKTEVQESEASTTLADKDLLELICESISSPGLLYCTLFIERTR